MLRSGTLRYGEVYTLRIHYLDLLYVSYCGGPLLLLGPSYICAKFESKYDKLWYMNEPRR